MKRLCLFIAVMMVSAPALAQGDTPVVIDIAKPDIAPVEPFPEGFRSLFFTVDEHRAVTDALARRMPSAPVDAAPAVSAIPESAVPDTPPRVIHLSGIVYTAPEDWSIWLNGQQLMPSRLPPHVRDVRVTKDYIDLQWYDAVTETVVPVRLRPQQRFNIDTKSFVGAGP